LLRYRVNIGYCFLTVIGLMMRAFIWVAYVAVAAGAAAAMLSATSAQAQEAKSEAKGCLDGVCIGMDVRSVPRTIAWKPVEPRFSPNTDPADIAEQRKRTTANAKKTYPDADAAIAELVDVMGYDRSPFDAKVLPSLAKLTVACRQMLWVGSFDSASGFPTEVTLMVYPGKSDQASFRVQKIKRTFPNIGMGAEFTTLRDKAEAAIKMPINDKTRESLDKLPVAQLSRSPANGTATLEIKDMASGSFDSRAWGKDAECLNRVTVN
jgi:hypothetical protein